MPDIQLVMVNGNTGVATRFLNDLEALNSYWLSRLPGTTEGFAADAWLANWDVVGPDNDNLLRNGNKAIRVDTGGALEYRSTGALKGAAFTADTVPEFETLRNYSTSKDAAAVFENMTAKELVDSIDNVLKFPDEEICSTCDRWGNGNPAERKKLAEKLIERKNALRKIKEELQRTDF